MGLDASHLPNQTVQGLHLQHDHFAGWRQCSLGNIQATPCASVSRHMLLLKPMQCYRLGLPVQFLLYQHGYTSGHTIRSRRQGRFTHVTTKNHNQNLHSCHMVQSEYIRMDMANTLELAAILRLPQTPDSLARYAHPQHHSSCSSNATHPPC